MEKAAIEHIEQMLADEMTKRFPGAPIERVALLQYGDEPMIEPGELLVRIILNGPDGETEHEEAMHAFHKTHREAFEQLRHELAVKLPEVQRLQIRASGDGGNTVGMMIRGPARSLEARALAGGELTPVMARLAPADLETLDTLITAGIAPNRAEAVRWSLARIRERPAYAQLRERAQEIEELKAQF